ncbi:hypothetical protein BZA05DRAFT_388994 [Tricharina praecox]|uniref:uncharacterized protein n=1 Tax=Tricharina praecox TaxID=43433 RepID=UPI0022204058|nr:uncharacterized protein BZA05DRAFT_388994 [Tricharina praecox]KAI5856568.1 hypothetical protein BZA05DRAFT_388994 [Tricharina praecox]
MSSTRAPDEADPLAALSGVQRQELIRLVMSIAKHMRHALRLATSTPQPSSDKRLSTRLYRLAMRSFDGWRDEVLVRISAVLQVPVPKDVDDKREVTPHEDPFLHVHFPPFATTLTHLEKREVIVESLLLLLLSLKSYDARSRVLLLHVVSSLALPLDSLLDIEAKTAKTLLETVQMTAEAESAKRVEASRSSNRWKIGLASVAGAALIGVTGGLAAPVVAAGIGSLMGGVGLGAVAGYLGVVAGSSTIIGALFGAYGGRMGGQMMQRYAKEVEDFKFIPVDGSSESRLRVGVAITGWVVDGEAEVVDPWRSVGGGLEAYALRWELDALTELGVSLSEILTSTAMSWVKLELAKITLSAALYSVIWPLAMLQTARVIDNPFSIAKHRADKAGLVLADAIINKAQGNRPITLVGYSLGARVVYSCLRSLAERGAYGMVENVVLMGAPVPATVAEWRELRSVVAGRVVNVYSKQDYVLAFLYRTSSVQLGVGGLQEIQLEGVENVDEGKLVSGHLMYRHAVGRILKGLLVGDMVLAEVEKGEITLKDLVEQEERAADRTIKMVENDKEMETKNDTSNESQKEVSLLDYEASEPVKTMHFETLHTDHRNGPSKNRLQTQHPLDSDVGELQQLEMRPDQQHGLSKNLLQMKQPLDLDVGDLQQLEARPYTPVSEPDPEVKDLESGEHKAIPEEDRERNMDAVLSRVEAKLAAMRMKRGGANR